MMTDFLGFWFVAHDRQTVGLLTTVCASEASVYWDVTPYGLAYTYRRFGESCYFHLEGSSVDWSLDADAPAREGYRTKDEVAMWLRCKKVKLYLITM
jgi:hypothetical protein